MESHTETQYKEYDNDHKTDSNYTKAYNRQPLHSDYNQNTQLNNIYSQPYSQHQNTKPPKSIEYNISLNIGETIDFNSDPEDSDSEEHNHSGLIMATTKHQIRIQLNNGTINTYFKNEIKIAKPIKQNHIPNIEHKAEPKMEHKHEQNNGVTNYEYNVINRPEILSLSETLKSTGIQKPYWWSNDSKTIVIPWDINKQISNEIIAKFYSGFYASPIDDINDIEIYSVQNLKLWKKYQIYKNNNGYNNMKEHYLWYGTGVTREVNDICNLGFQNIISIVFAKTAEYHYNMCKQQKLKSKKNNFQYLFLCRTLCDYESNGNVIEVNDIEQVYPAFLIRFKRVIEENNERKLMEEVSMKHEPKKQQEQQEQQVELNGNKIIVPEHGWVELYTDNGRKYYQNEITKKTQWTRPAIMDMDLNSQLDVPEIKQSQSEQLNNESQLYLLQQEMSGVPIAIAKSNPLPMNNAEKIEYHKTWTCTLCTFAENRMADGMCAMCDTPQPGKIKCNHCTSMNDENTNICVVCNKTISKDNITNSNGVTAVHDIDNQNDVNNNGNNDYDVMDPEVLKYIEEEFEYRNRYNTQEQSHPKPQPMPQAQPQQMIAHMNLIDDPNAELERDSSSDSNDMVHQPVNNMYNNMNNMNNMNNLIDDPYNNPYIDDNDFIDVPYMNDNDNSDLIDNPYGNMENNMYINYEDIKREQQFLRDLEFARKLQQQENEANGNLGFNFDKFIRQHSNDYEAKEQMKEQKKLPPQRQNNPVHGPPYKIMTLYHVTSNEAGVKIKESNKMIRGSKGMFGGGIYFAETPQSAHYKAEHGKNNGTLVTCKVYVGKEFRIDKVSGKEYYELTFTSLYKKGYDSVWAPNGSGKGECERVVYNWDQVVIVSVGEYSKMVQN